MIVHYFVADNQISILHVFYTFLEIVIVLRIDNIYIINSSNSSHEAVCIQACVLKTHPPCWLIAILDMFFCNKPMCFALFFTSGSKCFLAFFFFFFFFRSSSATSAFSSKPSSKPSSSLRISFSRPLIPAWDWKRESYRQRIMIKSSNKFDLKSAFVNS